MFSVRLTVYATILLAVGAVVFSHNAIDRWKNFKEVTAVIDDVNHKNVTVKAVRLENSRKPNRKPCVTAKTPN